MRTFGSSSAQKIQYLTIDMYLIADRNRKIRSPLNPSNVVSVETSCSKLDNSVIYLRITLDSNECSKMLFDVSLELGINLVSNFGTFFLIVVNEIRTPVSLIYQ